MTQLERHVVKVVNASMANTGWGMLPSGGHYFRPESETKTDASNQETSETSNRASHWDEQGAAELEDVLDF